MKVKILASGSKGNCTLVICGDTKILIDAGISERQITNILKENEIDVDSIDGILLSHTHSDHIKGLLQLVKRHKLKVYAHFQLLYELVDIIPSEFIIAVDNNFNINDVSICLLETSHDTTSYGFIIENNGFSMVYITDTGYINKKYYSQTRNKNIYIIESNHDEEMLMNGTYPYILKQRVIGDKGHLSNRYTGKYLNKVIGGDTKYIFLAHVSENNNTYDLALAQVKEELLDNNFDLANIIVARQDESSEMIEV